MRKATILTTLLLLGATPLFGQATDFEWIPDSEITEAVAPTGQAPPYIFDHQGARDVSGPHDMDGDGKMELVVSDYSGGGRVHVLESTGVDTWELVYTSPVIDSTSTTENLRAIAVGDLDGDGMGEIYAFAGRGYSATNPILALAPPALYILEATGEDNVWGPLPTQYRFDDPMNSLPDRWRTEQMTVVDVDGDGSQELLFGNNGSADEFDNWYILSATGDIGSLVGATWTLEAVWNSRDPVNRGGGSPYGMIAANLDGIDGMEIAMQSWNNFNFTNARATGPDTYEAPDENAADAFLWASEEDQVALFGCTALDMDENGDDEVYCPNLQTGDVSILNYEEGENALAVTTDNVVLDMLSGVSALGITHGDIDMDDNLELIGSGPSYTSEAFASGSPPVWIRIVNFGGGDVEDPANYTVLPVSFPSDMVDAFDTVNRDSAGVMTTYMEDGAEGPEFATKLAYLGDPDGDGFNEVAFAMQGVDDSLYVYNEVFNPADATYTRTQAGDPTPHPKRAFLRILSGNGLDTGFTDERIIVPSDYVLSSNYPNPFNPSTTFSFTLPLDKRVSVRVYDISGRLVRTLVDNTWYTAGTHQATWDGLSDGGMSVASGTYIYSLHYGNFRQSRTMLLIK